MGKDGGVSEGLMPQYRGLLHAFPHWGSAGGPFSSEKSESACALLLKAF